MARAGLEALTLRRLATELGVSAPTLYWHVRNKRQLLDLMAEALVARAGRSSSPAHGQPWWDWLAEQARLQWRVLTPHRDLPARHRADARQPGRGRVPARRGPAHDPVGGQLRDRLRGGAPGRGGP